MVLFCNKRGTLGFEKEKIQSECSDCFVKMFSTSLDCT